MCGIKVWWLRAYCLALSVCFVTSFNVDSFNYATHSGLDSSSMFGFSVAIHKESNNGWLIVGAPEAQSSYQQRVYRGGAVYKCPVDRDGNCQEIPFDTKGDHIDEQGQQMDNKTEQWFGATVNAAQSENGPIVACAPRYTWYPRKKTRRDPVGTCYVSTGSMDSFNEFSPCRTFQWGYHRQGSCQAGFSAAINSVGDRLFVGSPGSWYWQGQMYSIDAHAKFKYKPQLFSGTYGSEGQVYQLSLETRPAVFSTTEGSEKDDDSYMGYSTIIGDFAGNGEEGIAVGMPRGNNLKGKVLLFTWNLTNFLHHFSSDQLGSYYGYSLAASDVDGDGKVDLIIGAPMYTLPNNEGKYDVGRVYVIYHESEMGKFVATYVIDGFNSKSRFGQALASLGDINQDGYGDFAVGAPYDGPNERGAVYIYHGSSKGVRKKYSQVIFAEDVLQGLGGQLGGLRTFGFSVTGGLDLDGNEYPDMAVGAYLSNNAFVFRSRPVVRVEAAVSFLTPRKEIDIKMSNYNLRNGGRATLTEIDFCIKYYGKGIPYYIDLNLQYILDSKKPKNPRMGFVDNENMHTLNDTIRIYKDKNETCKRKNVFVKSDIKDKLTPLVAEVKYWMNQDESRTQNYYELQRNPRSVLLPVLDLNSPPTRKDSISVHKECGNDNICIPDLNLTVTTNVDKYLLGSKENLTFDIIVANTGEDSFETTLEVKYPENVYYRQSEDDKVVSHVLCNTYGNNTLKCEIGNPIPKDRVVRFKIYWQPGHKEGMAPTYDFMLSVNSTNQEDRHTLRDNQVNVSVGIWSNSVLSIRGNSHPQEVFFNSSLYTADIKTQNEMTAFQNRLSETTIGPQVTHVYYLRNEGPATVKETEVFFIWPSFTLGGEDLLYLLEQPHFSPSQNVQCDDFEVKSNYRGFNIEQYQRSIWERLSLDIEGGGTKVDAVVGGGLAKNRTSLDVAVESSGDASNINQFRQNQGTSQSHGVTNAQQGQHFTHTSSKQTHTINGVTQTSESNKSIFTNSSGSYVVSSGNVHKISGGNQQGGFQQGGYHQGGFQQGGFQQGEFQQGGGIRQGGVYQGGQQHGNKDIRVTYTSTGNLNKQQQGLTTGASSTSDFSVSGQHQWGAQGGSQQGVDISQGTNQCFSIVDGVRHEVPCQQQVGSTASTAYQNQGETSYKCYNIINGMKTETDCGQDGQQGISVIRQCFNRIDDQLIPIKCEAGSVIQSENGNVQIERENTIYRCYNQIAGKLLHVDCNTTSSSDRNVVYRCYKKVDGGFRPYTCKPGDIPEQFGMNRTYQYYQESTGQGHSSFQHATRRPHLANRYGESGSQSSRERQRVSYNRNDTGSGSYGSSSGSYGSSSGSYGSSSGAYGSSSSSHGSSSGSFRDRSQHQGRGGESVYQGNAGGGYQQSGGSSNGQYGSSESSYRQQSGGSRGSGYQQSGGSAYGQHGSSESSYQQQSGGSRGSGIYGAAGSSGGSQYQHGRGSQQSGESSRGYHSTNYDEDGSDEGKSISGYYDSNSNYVAMNKQGGRRDPSTYGKYDSSKSQENLNNYGIGGAALGSGFHVATVDLSDAGGAAGGQANTQHSTQNGRGGGNRQTWSEEGHWSETHEIPLTYNTIERDNVPTDKPSPQQKHFYGRKKRQSDDPYAEIRNIIQCKSVSCVYMRCRVGTLEKGKEVSIALRSRINAEVLRNVSVSQPVSVSSLMAARISKLPYIKTPSYQEVNTHEIFTTIPATETEIKPDIVPLWVVVLSAVAGTIILLLLAFLLYKMGFFKRNRPSSAPERQPLNRNGYHHGDEAL